MFSILLVFGVGFSVYTLIRDQRTSLEAAARMFEAKAIENQRAVAQLGALLWEVEWGGTSISNQHGGWNESECPFCFAPKSGGKHEPECPYVTTIPKLSPRPA